MTYQGNARARQPASAPLSKQQRAMVAPTVRRLAEEGRNDWQISAHFATYGPFPLTRSQVGRIRRQNGIVSLNDTARNGRVRRALRLEEGVREAFVDRVQALARDGLSDRQIAEALGLGLTRSQIAYLRETYGIAAGRPGPTWINNAVQNPAPTALAVTPTAIPAANAASAAQVIPMRGARPRRVKELPGYVAECNYCNQWVDAYGDDTAEDHNRLADGAVVSCCGSGRVVRWAPMRDEWRVAA